MKILFALPLLLLLGGALAEEQVSTRTCTNGHCIECLNGVCREARSEASDEQSGSSSTSCNTVNGVETCTTCNDGGCHTSTYAKREASGDFDSGDNHSNCNATTCWECMGWGECSMTNEPGKKPCCYYYTRPLGQLHSKHSNCNITGCTYCKGDGRCSMNNEPGLPPCCKFTPFPKEPLTPANQTYPFCIMTGCWYCDTPNARGNCQWIPKPAPIFDPASCNATTCWHCSGWGKCSSTNEPGQTPCCFYFPKPLWGHKDNNHRPNCNATGCWRCKGAGRCSMDGEPGLEPCCDFVSFELGASEEQTPSASTNCDTVNGNNSCIIFPKEPLHPANRTYPFCVMNGCWYCDDPAGRENCHWIPRGKREAGVQSTTKNCVNGRCMVCVNGQCNETRNRKREQNQSSSTTCNNGQCTKCVNGACTHYQD